MSEEETTIRKPVYPKRLPNGCMCEIVSTKERYIVHWLNESKVWQFEHLNDHTQPTPQLANCLKDKNKTEWEVDELLTYNVIKVISIPSYLVEVWNNTLNK